MTFSMRCDDPAMCFPMDRVFEGWTDVVCDDRVTLSTQYSTQCDSLAHKKLIDNQTLSVWVNEAGQWRLVAYQPTPIPRAS
jgi:hypothetical protein